MIWRKSLSFWEKRILSEAIESMSPVIEAQIVEVGLQEEVGERGARFEKAGQRFLGPVEAEEGVEVGSADVHVDENDLPALPGEVGPDGAGDERFAGAALASADGPDFAFAVLSRLGS